MFAVSRVAAKRSSRTHSHTDVFKKKCIFISKTKISFICFMKIQDDAS